MVVGFKQVYISSCFLRLVKLQMRPFGTLVGSSVKEILRRFGD